MNVREIIELFLKENGFDGLCGPREFFCEGCKIGSVGLLSGEKDCKYMADCIPGYLHDDGIIRPDRQKYVISAAGVAKLQEALDKLNSYHNSPYPFIKSEIAGAAALARIVITEIKRES